MTDISVSKVKIEFVEGVEILKGVSFEVTAGEHIGVLGRNGAGKTTLFRIISGEIEPDEGTVVTFPGKRVGVLAQIPDYPEDFTGEDVLKTAQERVKRLERRMRELEEKMAAGDDDVQTLRRYDEISNRFMDLGGYELERFRNTVANGLGIPMTQRQMLFSELSGGEKTRMNLARLMLEDTDILLLDEPTNHLDMAAVEWLEDYISRFRGTVLTASHDRYFLDRTVSRIVEIEDGVAEFYSGNYSFYLEEKQRRYEERLRQYEKEQAKIEQLEAAAEKLHLWAFMGNDALHKRAFSIEKRIERIRTTDKPQTQRKLTARFGSSDFRGDEVLVLRGVSKSFGEKKLFSDLELLVRPGERVALIGANGTGKSTLVKIIMGEENADGGLVRIGPSIKTAYLPQIVEFEDPYMSVLDAMREETGLDTQTARNRLGAFNFRDKDVFTFVSDLSGGEKSRLKLCILMQKDIDFLILDEPTNHLDIISREWVEDALSDFGGTMLFVSHDRYFIDKFATRIWELRSGGELQEFNGGFTRYMELYGTARIEPPKQEKPKKEKPRRERSGSPEKVRARLEREIESVENEIADVERQEEEFQSDYERLMELSQRKQELSERLDGLYEEWGEL